MNINRREFLVGTGVIGAVAGLGAKSAAAACDALPVPEGREFEGMGGAFSAMYTPFTADNRINEGMIDRIVEFGISSGLKGFYLTGTTGEGMLMTPAERAAVIRRVVRASRGRAKIIAHIGAVGTDESLVNVRNAADAGVDWLSAIAPVFYGRGFGGTYSYYKRLSEETDLPFMIYAMNTGVNPERDAKLFDLKNVKGMKYTGHSCWDIARLRAKVGKAAVFYSGADEQSLPAMSMRDVFNGCIGTSQNVIPKHFTRMCSAIAIGDMTEAVRLQAEIVRFVDVMLGSADGNGSWHKAMMRYIGLDCGSARSPNGWPLSEAEYASLSARLDALGFVDKAKT